MLYCTKFSSETKFECLPLVVRHAMEEKTSCVLKILFFLSENSKKIYRRNLTTRVDLNSKNFHNRKLMPISVICTFPFIYAI